MVRQVGEAGDGVAQRADAPDDRLSGPAKARLPSELHTLLDLTSRDRRQVGEDLELVVTPLPGMLVRDAEGAQNVARARAQRNAGVGAEVARPGTLGAPDELVLPDVVDHQWFAGRDGELAERGTQGRGALRDADLVGLRGPGEELSVGRHQRHVRTRRPHQGRGHPREPVERRVPRPVEQARPLEHRETFRIGDRSKG